jgi:hypothetical protein
MNLRSHARIRVSNQSLLVRFEKVGPKDKFTQICHRWQTAFPQSIWNDEFKGWELPSANFDDVKQFCEKMFWKVTIEPLKPLSKSSQQMSLNL